MIYVLLADGFEEVEAFAPVDIMRRDGIDVTVAGVGCREVCGAHSIKVVADMTTDDIDFDTVDGIVLPGGMPGTLNLQRDSTVQKLLKHCMSEKLLVAAICAAPLILGDAGFLDGRDAVCFPGFEEHLKGARLAKSGVAVCENIITAKGAGVALEFGAAIVNHINGKDGAGEEILAQMQYKS